MGRPRRIDGSPVEQTAERDIVCKAMSLHDGMTVLGLEFRERVPQEGDTPYKTVRFSHKLVLEDYQYTGTLKPEKDDEGHLVHQNRVFLRGHFRKSVIANIADAMVEELYPGRDPRSVKRAIGNVKICAGRLNASAYGDANSFQALETAIEDALRSRRIQRGVMGLLPEPCGRALELWARGGRGRR